MIKRYHSIAIVTVVLVGAMCLFQCSSPTQTDSAVSLTVTPSSGVPGAALKVSGLTGLDATTDTLTATIGGQIAPVIVNDSGQVFVSIPLFLDDSGLVTVPAEKLDLVIAEKRTTIGEVKGAITVEALPTPTRTLEDLSSALTVIANTLDSTLASFSPGPGVQDQYVTAIIAALDSLINSSNPASLGSSIAGVNADSSLAYLTAILDANGVIEGFMDMASQLQAISVPATTTTYVTANNSLYRSASPTVIPTTLTDQDLARRMQFYVIAKMFGETVISNTGQTFAETVGTVAGVLGIAGVDVPYVAIVSAVLTLIDVVVNKIVVGALPATIDSMSVTLVSDTINPGDATDASIYILTSNAPPGLGVQDIVGLTLTALGLFGDSQPIQSFKEVLWNTANFFVGMMQSTVAAYSAMHPELNLDVTVAAMPPMKWDAYIDDPHLVKCQSLTPSIVTGMTSSPNWKADDNNYGEGRIYVMPATGAGALLLSLPPGFTYNGGAFGMDMTASRTISVWVAPKLALQVDFADVISVGGANVLGVDAGYVDANGNPHWESGIDISLSVTDGGADVTSGVTDAQGHFSSAITIDSTADSVTIQVVAHGANNTMADTTVVAQREGDFIIDAELRYPDWACSYVHPGEVIPLEVTAFRPDSGRIANAHISARVIGGGSLGSATGTTDAYGVWSTTYTAPQIMSGPIEIRLTVTPPFGQSKTKTLTVNRLTVSSGTGPVFVWGQLPDTNATINGSLYCHVTVAGGANDDGSSSFVQISNTCDTGLTAFSSLSIGTSTGFRYGSGGIGTSFDITENSPAKHTLQWSASGGGGASGEYAEIGLQSWLQGSILYRKPSSVAFPAGAVLKMTVAWGGGSRLEWHIAGEQFRDSRVGGQRTFNVALPSGKMSLLLPVRISALEGSSGSDGGWSLASSVTIQMECLNCGE